MTSRGFLCVVAVVLSVSAAHIPAQAANPPHGRRPAAEKPELTFDPADCEHLDLVRRKLAISAAEMDMFRRQGFVVLGQSRQDTFATAYYDIYGRDLPVMITSDSILHAVHHSFDEIFKQMEEVVLAGRLAKILEGCHAELARRQVAAADPHAASYDDLDLYLTVARNLLAGSGQGQLAIGAVRNQDGPVRQIMQSIAAEHMQDPLYGEGTVFYGGRRPLDYSQFRPRGHYTKTLLLQNYFRAMMWLSRADCGFHIAPAHPESGIHNNDSRELADAVLLVELLQAAGKFGDLERIDAALEFLVGRSDNLRPCTLAKLMQEAGVPAVADLADAGRRKGLAEKIAANGEAQQKICSQVMYGSKVPGEQMPLTPMFQMLGQRFVVDSYVLSNVVYDTVPPNPAGEKRWMPSPLDAMTALGNPESRALLAGELAHYGYQPQLDAACQFTSRYLADPAGQKSLYDLWLSALATLHADMSRERLFPQAMQTEAWRRKQLQTQLASWAELRHDSILVVKQSYTRQEECSYPAAFVEPYPEFYARIGKLAQRADEGFAELENKDRDRGYGVLGTYRAHWRMVAQRMETLERLAGKELHGEPFTAEEQKFLKQTVEIKISRGDCGALLSPRNRSISSDPADYEVAFSPRGTREYGGWYCDLFYPREGLEDFRPTVADVHTNPRGSEVLEVGTGPVRLALVAVDNGEDRAVYVAPVSTYYEFRQAVDHRLSDEEFKSMLEHGQAPPQPEWTRAFGTRD